MSVLAFRATLSESEILDTGEALAGILDQATELELPPSLVDLLLALDDAITTTVVLESRNGQPLPEGIGRT